jgi:hypothetical protein
MSIQFYLLLIQYIQASTTLVSQYFLKLCLNLCSINRNKEFEEKAENPKKRVSKSPSNPKQVYLFIKATIL